MKFTLYCISFQTVVCVPEEGCSLSSDPLPLWQLFYPFPTQRSWYLEHAYFLSLPIIYRSLRVLIVTAPKIRVSSTFIKKLNCFGNVSRMKNNYRWQKPSTSDFEFIYDTQFFLFFPYTQVPNGKSFKIIVITNKEDLLRWTLPHLSSMNVSLLVSWRLMCRCLSAKNAWELVKEKIRGEQCENESDLENTGPNNLEDHSNAL